jgi:type I restriction-modification system DNA methylase subunit
MTLQEAILEVIRNNGEPIRARDISNAINKYSLFKQKDETPVTQNQVLAKAKNFSELFKFTIDKKIYENSDASFQQELLLKLVRNFLAHNYSENLDLVIPFFFFYVWANKKQNDDVVSPSLEYLKLSTELDAKIELIKSIDNNIVNELPIDVVYNVKNYIEGFDENVILGLLTIINRFEQVIYELNDVESSTLFQKLVSQISSTQSKGSEFATPDIISNFVAGLVDFKSSEIVGDPFAGFCILLNKALKSNKNLFVYANDINPKVGSIGIMNLIINGVKKFEYTFTDSFADSNVEEKFDWIVSNPPFSIKLNTSLSIIYKKLKANGKAIVVIPNSFLFSTDKVLNDIRKKMINDKAIRSVISLPNGIFQPYSGVASSIIFIDKQNNSGGIVFADYSKVSKEEFEYRFEEFITPIKKKIDVSGIVTFVEDNYLKFDESLNLSPKKFIYSKEIRQFQNGIEIKLKDVIERRVPNHIASSFNTNDEQEGIPYIRITDLAKDPKLPYIVSNPARYISDIEEVKSYKLVKEGYVLLAKVGNNLKPSIYKLSEPGVAASNVICFIVNKEIVSSEYLVEQLNSIYFKQQLESIQIQGAGPTYYKESDLFELKILLPSIEDQIANSSIQEKRKEKFWDKFKSNLIEKFKEEEDLIFATSNIKEIKEKEMIFQ